MPATPTPFPRLAAPAQRALVAARLKSLDDLARITQAELAALHGMGPNAMGRLKEAMKAAGVSFRRP